VLYTPGLITSLTENSAWQVNTDLLPFDMDDVKKDVESGNQAKKNKALWEAYKIAADGRDLAWFKEMLAAHDTAMQEDLEQREQKELEKKEKAAKRKSTAAVESEDVDMEDAGGDAAPSAKKAKVTKKRKKEDDSEDENGKVCMSFIDCSTVTNPLTACKDSQDEAQVDDKDPERGICRQA
jgi:hypothetical protein